MEQENKVGFRVVCEVVYHISVIISLVVAAATFYYQYDKDQNAKNNYNLMRWRQAAVYTIIKDKGPLEYNAIKQEYLRKAQQEAKVFLNKSDLQDDMLDSILFELQQSKMAELASDKRYSIALAVSDVMGSFQQNLQRPQWVYELVTNFLATESNKCSAEQIYLRLLEKNPDLTQQEFNGCLTDLLAKKVIFKNKDGKLYSSLKKG